MTAPFDLNAALTAAQTDYMGTVAAIRAAYSAGKPWPPVVTIVAPPAAVIPAVNRIPQAPGTNIMFLGERWLVQSGTPDGVCLGDDGLSAFFHAKAGEHASFDPDRKIRAELGGYRPFAKGEVIRLAGSINIDPATVMGDATFLSLIQIHAADVYFASGVEVSSGPMFCIDMLPGSGGTTIRVRAETSTGLPLPNTYAPTRVLGTFPITFGVDHAFDIAVVDGHGGPGSVKVMIDGKTICDFTGPTGFEFVDLVPPVNGKPQPSGSNWKIGIYAGKDSGPTPPATSAAYTIKLAA